jgi:hypothetical protein
MQPGIHFRRVPGTNLIQAFRDCAVSLALQKFRKRLGVQFAPRNPQPMGSCFRPAEKLVRQ